MIRHRFTPLIAAILMLAAGLVLGAGKGSNDTSTANTVSKVLLTLGFVAFVVSFVVLVVRLRRARRTAG